MICPSCGLPNPATSLSCAACGAAIAMPGAAPPAVAPASAAAPAPSAALATPAFVPVYKPVPGPVDRESFATAQRRNRRRTWRQVVACAVAAVLTGIPLSLVLTPLIFAVVLIATRLAQVVVPVPDGVWHAYERVGLVLVRVFDALDDPSTTGVMSAIRNVPLPSLLALAAIWLLPGILLMLMLWPALGLLLRRAGAGAALLSLDAREPRLDDLEERQLVNVIEELAIAAGIPAPKVMLIDAPVANAAVVGSSIKDAVIVVARPLLDDLDRDETQGVLAHLVASIGNGDLRAALAIIAVFQTFGFASALIRLPIDGKARRTVWRMLRYVIWPGRASQRAAEARAVSDLLTGGLDDFGEQDDFEWVNQPAPPPAERPWLSLRLLLYFPFVGLAIVVVGLLLGVPYGLRVLAVVGLGVVALLLLWYQRRYAVWVVGRSFGWAHVMVLLPYYLGAMMPLLVLMMLKSFLLEPIIALLWRTRRYLADATAVQLTRNPDGLARGLVELVRRGGIIPGGQWAAPLFIVGEEASQLRFVQAYQQQSIARVEAEMRKLDPEGDDRGARQVLNQARAFYGLNQAQRAEMLQRLQENQPPVPAMETESGFPGGGGVGSLHPNLNKRLKKLRAMGSSVGELDPLGGIKSPYSRGFGLLFGLVVVPLLLLAGVLMLVALVLLTGISLLFTSLLMMLVYGLFTLIAPV